MERLWAIHGNTPTRLRMALSHLYATLESNLLQTDDKGQQSDTVSVPNLDVSLLPSEPKAAAREDLALSRKLHLLFSYLPDRRSCAYMMYLDGFQT